MKRYIKATTDTYEGVPGLIFGTAHITPTFIDIDGYVNKKSEVAMLRQLARAIRPYSKDESDLLLDMVKYGEMNQIHPISSDGAAQYILEWEDVPSAARYDENDEMEYADANYYVHIRFVK